MWKAIIFLVFLTAAVCSTPVEEQMVKREAVPSPVPQQPFFAPPQQSRPPREAYGPGYGPGYGGYDRGYGGGEYLGGGGGVYEKEFFVPPREEYGRFGGGYEREPYFQQEYGRYGGGGYERDFYGPEYGRFGYEREEIIRPEIIEKVVRPEVIEKVERFEKPYGHGSHGYGHKCNCNKFENAYDFPRFEGLYGGKHGYDGGAYPGLCLPYPNYNNYNY